MPSGAADPVRPIPPVSGFNIQAAIDKQLGTLPPDSKVAFVATATAEQGERGVAKVAVMVKLDDGWSFSGYLEKEYHGDGKAGVEVRFVR